MCEVILFVTLCYFVCHFVFLASLSLQYYSLHCFCLLHWFLSDVGRLDPPETGPSPVLSVVSSHPLIPHWQRRLWRSLRGPPGPRESPCELWEHHGFRWSSILLPELFLCQLVFEPSPWLSATLKVLFPISCLASSISRSPFSRVLQSLPPFWLCLAWLRRENRRESVRTYMVDSNIDEAVVVGLVRLFPTLSQVARVLFEQSKVWDFFTIWSKRFQLAESSVIASALCYVVYWNELAADAGTGRLPQTLSTLEH